MGTGRLEAFSDGVLAIIITIMVLQLKVPEGAGLADLLPLLPRTLTYLFSFIYVGIYWNNHHHLLKATQEVDGAVLWANLHLLFWLSLLPFATEWIGLYIGKAWPVAVYGIILLMSAMAWSLLAKTILRIGPKNVKVKEVYKKDIKGQVSISAYALGVIMAFFLPWVSIALYAFIALMWLVPDRRIEKSLR